MNRRDNLRESIEALELEIEIKSTQLRGLQILEKVQTDVGGYESELSSETLKLIRSFTGFDDSE